MIKVFRLRYRSQNTLDAISKLRTTVNTTLTDSQQSIIKKIKSDNEMLTVRNMSFSEVEEVRVNWAKKENWPGIKNGMFATYQLDPSGFYCLENSKGKLASLSAVTYPSMKTAYLGFFIVPAELRLKRYGSLLFKTVLEHTREQRGILSFGLNCFETMSPMYYKWGFKTIMVDNIWRLTMASNSERSSSKTIKELDTIQETEFQKLVSYDESVFGSQRKAFLQSFIYKPGTTLAVCYQNNSNVQGYAVLSEREPPKPELHNSYRVGPWYADNATIAKELLEKLLIVTDLKQNEQVYLETTENNIKATEIVKALHFQQIAKLDKMFKGAGQSQNFNKVFGYSSLVTG
jgi:hypothetical protein